MIIKFQFFLTQKGPLVFKDDNFVLGYVFGMAEMAYFQHGGSLNDQDQALNFILLVFNEIFEEEASTLLSKSIQNQQLSKFEKGRKIGVDDFGIWVKANGKIKPKGLIVHFQE